MPTLVYEGKEYEISVIDAEWLKKLAIGVKHRIETLEKAIDALKKSLVKVVLDGQDLLVPKGAVMEVIKREELEKIREKMQGEKMVKRGEPKKRPPIGLPIRKPIEEQPPGPQRYQIPEPWLRRRAPPVEIQPLPMPVRISELTARLGPILRHKRPRILLLTKR